MQMFQVDWLEFRNAAIESFGEKAESCIDKLKQILVMNNKNAVDIFEFNSFTAHHSSIVHALDALIGLIHTRF